MDVFKTLLDENREYKRLSRAVAEGCPRTGRRLTSYTA